MTPEVPPPPTGSSPPSLPPGEAPGSFGASTPPVPRLPGPVTRRWLWWRAMWRYALAHKPLCERFRPHVWRIGGVHLCRSCALVWLALITTAATLLLVPPDPSVAVITVVLLALPVVVLSVPPLYDRWPRWLRDVLRLGLGATIAWLAALWLLQLWLAAAVSTGGLLLAHRLFARQHRRRSVDACAGCPELADRGHCSGFRHQAAAHARFDEMIVARMR